MDKHTPRVITMVDVYQVARRSRRAILLGAGAGVLLAVGLGLVLPRVYTSRASFVPQKKETQSALSGLASQFGFALPNAGDGESPEFYSALLTSRTILGQVADSLYSVERSGDGARPQPLATLFDIQDDNPGKQRELVIDELLKVVRAEKTRTTGMVNITATTEWPRVSEQLVANMLAMVSDFNVHSRQTRASAERKFVEKRVMEARAALRDAENNLQGFLQSNRSTSGAPHLQIARTRLMRAVSDREQVLSGLEASYEKARIDEVRDTPVISIVESPVVPVRADPRKLPGLAVLGALLGALAMIVVLGGRGAMRSLRAAADQRDALDSEARSADLRSSDRRTALTS